MIDICPYKPKHLSVALTWKSLPFLTCLSMFKPVLDEMPLTGIYQFIVNILNFDILLVCMLETWSTN